MALAKISDQELSPRNLSGLRALLRRLGGLFNALLNFQIILDSKRNLFTLSESNATLELNLPAAVAKAAGAAAVPMPFDLIPPTNAGNTSVVYGQVNPFSLFLPDESSTDTMDVGGLGQDVALSAGLLFYLQVDAADVADNYIQAVKVVYSAAGFGNQRIIFSGSGTSSDPYIWGKSFFPTAQVLASDGTASHGGTVFTSGDGSSHVEVVNLCGSHLSLRATVVLGKIAAGVVKTAATFG